MSSTIVVDQTASAPAESAIGRLVDLPLETLVANPANIRSATVRADLLAAFRAEGVAAMLLPLVGVVQDDGTVLLSDGHSRLATAIEANTDIAPELAITKLPVLLREDLGDKAEQVTAMIRTGTGAVNLTGAEVARGVQQLTLAGLNVSEIVRRTNLDKAQVKRAARTTAEQVEAVGAATRAPLDLAATLVLTDISDDAKAVTQALQGWSGSVQDLERRVQRELARREAVAAVAARQAELKAAGVTLLTHSPSWEEQKKLPNLRDLRHADKPIQAEAHQSCPGHRAWVGLNYAAEVTEEFYCEGWRAHGHVHRDRPLPTDADRAERKQKILLNKEMDIANGVRRKWLTEQFARKDMPVEVMRWAAGELLARADIVASPHPSYREILAAFRGEAEAASVPKSATLQRVVVLTVAALAAWHESRISKKSWKEPYSGSGEYMRMLIEVLGFSASLPERILAGLADASGVPETVAAEGEAGADDEPVDSETDEQIPVKADAAETVEADAERQSDLPQAA